MARIRTIKPEFWTSEQVMDLKPVSRLLFIGLWNFVDDFGRAPVAPRTIKAQVMPGDNFTGDDIQEMLNEIRSSGLIVFYSAEGKEYFEITGWSKHQKIDNPSKYKVCPAPTGEQTKVLAIPSEELPKIGLEGKGEEKETKVKEGIPSPAKPQARANDVFENLKRAYPKRAGNYGWKAAERKFNSLVKTGVDPKIIIAAALRLGETLRSRVGTEFIPMPSSWLNSEDFVESAVIAFDEAAPVDWDAICDSYKKFGIWSRHAPGNSPDSSSCLCPPDILAKHGIRSNFDALAH